MPVSRNFSAVRQGPYYTTNGGTKAGELGLESVYVANLPPGTLDSCEPVSQQAHLPNGTEVHWKRKEGGPCGTLEVFCGCNRVVWEDMLPMRMGRVNVSSIDQRADDQDGLLLARAIPGDEKRGVPEIITKSDIRFTLYQPCRNEYRIGQDSKVYRTDIHGDPVANIGFGDHVLASPGWFAFMMPLSIEECFLGDGTPVTKCCE